MQVLYIHMVSTTVHVRLYPGMLSHTGAVAIDLPPLALTWYKGGRYKVSEPIFLSSIFLSPIWTAVDARRGLIYSKGLLSRQDLTPAMVVTELAPIRSPGLVHRAEARVPHSGTDCEGRC